MTVTKEQRSHLSPGINQIMFCSNIVQSYSLTRYLWLS